MAICEILALVTGVRPHRQPCLAACSVPSCPHRVLFVGGKFRSLPVPGPVAELRRCPTRPRPFDTRSSVAIRFRHPCRMVCSAGAIKSDAVTKPDAGWCAASTPPGTPSGAEEWGIFFQEVVLRLPRRSQLPKPVRQFHLRKSHPEISRSLRNPLAKAVANWVLIETNRTSWRSPPVRPCNFREAPAACRQPPCRRSGPKSPQPFAVLQIAMQTAPGVACQSNIKEKQYMATEKTEGAVPRLPCAWTHPVSSNLAKCQQKTGNWPWAGPTKDIIFRSRWGGRRGPHGGGSGPPGHGPWRGLSHTPPHPALYRAGIFAVPARGGKPRPGN